MTKRLFDHPGGPMTRAPRPAVSVQFPNNQPWPVKPPDEHWLKRWHWLRTDEGDFHLAAWTHRFGWHWDWSGKPDPEDMSNWTYVGPVPEPRPAEDGA